MSATMLNVGDFYGAPGSPERSLVIQHNKLVADIDLIHAAILAITAKLDLDGGVTGTDFASLTNPAAITTAKIGVNGTAITA